MHKHTSYVVLFLSVATISLVANENNGWPESTIKMGEKFQNFRQTVSSTLQCRINPLREHASIDGMVNRMTVLDSTFRAETVKPCLRAAKVVLPVLIAYQCCKSVYASVASSNKK